MTNQPRHSKPAASSRHGVVLICALCCMAVVAALVGSLVKTVLLTRQQLRIEAYSRQAEWCAEAGLQRAAQRHLADPSYVGEDWHVVPNPSKDQQRAHIMTDVREDLGQTWIDVTAEYPAGDLRSVRRRLSLQLP